MSPPRKLLIIAGLGLAVWGMSFGLWYALFDEHQTLEHMGASLTTGFVRAAERNLPAAHAAIDQYAAAKYEYVREVDVHSHWIGLAMLLIILGVVFDRVAFDERARLYLAAALVVGSAIFPLGVILQTVLAGPAAEALAAIGGVMVTAALAAVALGFARGTRPA
jgi:dipeptide/tripeptide permease